MEGAHRGGFRVAVVVVVALSTFTLTGSPRLREAAREPTVEGAAPIARIQAAAPSGPGPDASLCRACAGRGDGLSELRLPPDPAERCVTFPDENWHPAPERVARSWARKDADAAI